MILAGTGHRPGKLGGYGEDVHLRLICVARGALARWQPKAVISGMALGWDQAVAQAAVDLGIPFIAAVPFEDQAKRWPRESWPRYTRLLESAAAAHVVSETPGSHALNLRNEWMVDRCDRLLALWDGSWGGTFNCLKYAARKGKPVENLWSEWVGDLSDLLR